MPTQRNGLFESRPCSNSKDEPVFHFCTWKVSLSGPSGTDAPTAAVTSARVTVRIESPCRAS